MGELISFTRAVRSDVRQFSEGESESFRRQNERSVLSEHLDVGRVWGRVDLGVCLYMPKR